MSIYVYTGTPGTGKSLHSASDIRFALNRPSPRPVIANFDINRDVVRHPQLFTYCPNEQLTADFITGYATRFWETSEVPFQEDYILLVVDESQLLFNSRLWSSKDRMSYLEFLSQSRKYGVKVILVAQSAKMIDNQFRMLIEFEVNHRRFSSMGLIGDIVSLLTFGRVFCQVTSMFQLNEHIGTDFYIAKNADFRLYDSYSKFERTETQKQAQPQTEPTGV